MNFYTKKFKKYRKHLKSAGLYSLFGVPTFNSNCFVAPVLKVLIFHCMIGGRNKHVLSRRPCTPSWKRWYPLCRIGRFSFIKFGLHLE